MTDRPVQTILLNNGNSTFKDVHKLVHNFGRNASLFKHSIALSQLTLPYSWYNITADYGNNTFSYNWPAATPVQIDMTIPDSFLEINQISDYMQFIMAQNYHYLVKDEGLSTEEIKYLISWSVNVSAYRVTFIFDPLPTVLPDADGFDIPSAASWLAPGADANPTLIITNAEFGKLLGQSAATLGAGATHTEVNGDLVPQIQPATSINIECNFVANDIQLTRNLYSFAPDVPYGSFITLNPTYPIFHKVLPQSYADIEISFVDQNDNKIDIVDPNGLQVQLIVRTDEE